ncbi:unnamed protein product [Amoebophrya sp. A25]|nr:unnamed protein product [Amoebophrya sp. A25]|eukprot:GSA25T00008958001.1
MKTTESEQGEDHEVEDQASTTVRAVKNLKDCLRSCSSVICCRVSPSQKRDLVRFLERDLDSRPPLSISYPNAKQRRRTNFVLAIGDGANDCGMLREATVSVGLFGKEGSTAARLGDFAVGHFACLQRLIFVHGREAHRKNTVLLVYMVYKNAVCTLPFVFYGLFSCRGEGVQYVPPLLYALYNCVYACFPILFYCVFDRGADSLDTLVTQNAQSYEQCRTPEAAGRAESRPEEARGSASTCSIDQGTSTRALDDNLKNKRDLFAADPPCTGYLNPGRVGRSLLLGCYHALLVHVFAFDSSLLDSPSLHLTERALFAYFLMILVANAELLWQLSRIELATIIGVAVGTLLYLPATLLATTRTANQWDYFGMHVAAGTSSTTTTRTSYSRHHGTSEAQSFLQSRTSSAEELQQGIRVEVEMAPFPALSSGTTQSRNFYNKILREVESADARRLLFGDERDTHQLLLSTLLCLVLALLPGMCGLSHHKMYSSALL